MATSLEALRRQFEQSRDSCAARARAPGIAEPGPGWALRAIEREAEARTWGAMADVWDLAARCLAEVIAQGKGG